MAYHVDTMYVDSSTVTVNGKTYTRHLLRESYRQNGKVKHRTVANISNAAPEEIEAIRLALRHKHELHHLGSIRKDLALRQGPSVGAVVVIRQVAQRLGIAEALGSDRQGRLALWQVMARIINQGSRLAAVRLAQVHAACDLLAIASFDEDDLYENLNWLTAHQADIEDRLYAHRRSAAAAKGESAAAKQGSLPGKTLYLYDVTSVYLEGQKNDLAAFGYNRDGKKGKLQVVVGLLEDEWGDPLSTGVSPHFSSARTASDCSVGDIAKQEAVPCTPKRSSRVYRPYCRSTLNIFIWACGAVRTGSCGN